MSEFNYDVGDEQEQSFEPIPAGDYFAVIDNSAYGMNKKETGMVLNLVWQVIDEGPYKGRKIFENLNLEHKNQQAVQIARGAMNAICNAIGLARVQDPSQLCNIPMIIKVGIKDDPQYGPKNVIKSHKRIEGGTTNPMAPQDNGEATPPSSPSNNGATNNKKHPWEK